MPRNHSPESIRALIKEKVDGVWEPKHDEKGHHYLHVPTGTLVDSVTTQIILDKPHLTPWAVEIGVRYFIDRLEFDGPENRDRLVKEAKFAYKSNRDEAGSVGTAVHRQLEDHVEKWIQSGVRPKTEGPYDDISDGRIVAGIRSGLSIFDKYDIIPIAAELLVGSTKVKCAGTLDLLCLYKGELAIFDYKTSNRVSDEYALQLAAYKYFLQEMLGLRIKHVLVAHLSKDYDKCDLHSVLRHRDAYEAFKHLSRTYQWLKNHEEKLELVRNRITSNVSIRKKEG